MLLEYLHQRAKILTNENDFEPSMLYLLRWSSNSFTESDITHRLHLWKCSGFNVSNTPTLPARIQCASYVLTLNCNLNKLNFETFLGITKWNTCSVFQCIFRSELLNIYFKTSNDLTEDRFINSKVVTTALLFRRGRISLWKHLISLTIIFHLNQQSFNQEHRPPGSLPGWTPTIRVPGSASYCLPL